MVSCYNVKTLNVKAVESLQCYSIYNSFNRHNVRYQYVQSLYSAMVLAREASQSLLCQFQHGSPGNDPSRIPIIIW